MVTKDPREWRIVVPLEARVQEVYESFVYYAYGSRASACDIIIGLLESTGVYPPEKVMQDLYLTVIEEYTFQDFEKLFDATYIRPTRETIQQGRRYFHEAGRIEEFEKLKEFADDLAIDFTSHYAIDTNVFLDLILSPKGQEHYKREYNSFPDRHVHTHSLCLGEAKGVLKGKYGYTIERADEEIDETKRKFSIAKFEEKSTTEDISRVREIGGSHGLKTNEKDIFIIHQFSKWKVTTVSRDSKFLDTCRGLGLNVLPWPDFYDRPAKTSRRERW